jgi:hypothetical protein
MSDRPGGDPGALEGAEDDVLDDSATLDALGGAPPAQPATAYASAAPTVIGSSAPPAVPAGEAQDTPAQQALNQAQARLDAQLAADQAAMPGYRATQLRGPAGAPFRYAERVTQAHTDRVVAGLPAEEAGMAARTVEGEEAAIAGDEARAKRDAALCDAREPGTALDAEAAAIVAEIDRDEQDAMGDAISARMVAAEADRDRKHHDLAGAQAAEDQAQRLLASASADLADADAALARLEADMRAAGETPAG